MFRGIEPVDTLDDETDAPVEEMNTSVALMEKETQIPVDDGSSRSVTVPEKLIDQVIGQEHAVEVIRKAAIQRRHVMMIGTPVRASPCWQRQWLSCFQRKRCRISLHIQTLTIKMNLSSEL